jgi:hypothetical protein
VGSLALKVFEQAIAEVEAGNAAGSRLERARGALIAELDRYDRLHFGKTVDEAAVAILETPPAAGQIQRADGQRADG